MKTLSLSAGYVAIIDDEDFDRASQLNWYLDRTKSPNRIYVRNIKQINNKVYKIRLHQFILGRQPRGIDIDHANGNGLDNRKCNLRLVTRSQNNLNRHKKRSDAVASKIIGVSYHKKINRWISEIRINKERRYLGCFKTELEAAATYSDAKNKVCGI